MEDDTAIASLIDLTSVDLATAQQPYFLNETLKSQATRKPYCTSRNRAARQLYISNGVRGCSLSSLLAELFDSDMQKWHILHAVQATLG